ncbi:hypothetical protein OBE_13192 [human gut metagenome]|uniref:Uncharacterized protein n=1 Tax=human gut metagenome TaxID=408170 RepID=K1SA01_9ZZZZ
MAILPLTVFFTFYGYDHMEKLERVRMREKEELVMEQLGLPASSSYIVDDDMA